MACVVDKDGAPTRHQDLSPAAARELTRRIGSMCFFLELANEMSNRHSDVDALASTAGRPFKLEGSTVRMYLREYEKEADTKPADTVVESQRGSWGANVSAG